MFLLNMFLRNCHGEIKKNKKKSRKNEKNIIKKRKIIRVKK